MSEVVPSPFHTVYQTTSANNNKNDDDTMSSRKSGGGSRKSVGGAAATAGSAAPVGSGVESSKKDNKEQLWAIKKPDAEPLLRYDIQWQVLEDIFNDRSFFYTAPVDSNAAPPAEPILLNFDQLYLEAILSSMKTTQALRMKLIEQPQFAISFCKICLLINVGRINTTMAFYPQMKTALRTYHPVPSLQADESSRKDMQDAPRIKGILKACFLDWEVLDQSTTLKDVARKRNSPQLVHGPPTTVVTAIFLLFNEASWASEKYFPPGFDILDLFYPSDMPSLPRARAFLSIVHHILEDLAFLEDFETVTPPHIPLPTPILLSKTPPEDKENADPQEELDYARDMKDLRGGIVKTVPAYLKRDELAKEKEAAKVEKELIKAGEVALASGAGGAEPAKKKRRVDGMKTRSYAKVAHDNDVKDFIPEILPTGWQEEDWSSVVPIRSGLPTTWEKIKRDLLDNRDPDYDSDEEESWSYDYLLRRQLVTIRNPSSTGAKRVAPSEIKDYQEWLRRKEEGYVEEGYEAGDLGGILEEAENGLEGSEGGGDGDE